MKSILNHAQTLYDDGGEDTMWTYLNRLIMTGDIEEDTAVQIAFMIERGQ